MVCLSNDHYQVFLFGTNQISTNKILLIHQVIPIFDVITTALEDNIENDAEVRGFCYGVKREAASRSGTSQNPQNTNTKSNTNLKTQITRSNSVRGETSGVCTE